MEKMEVIEWMKMLTDKQFVDVFYEAVSNRRVNSNSEESHWVLAIAERINDNPDWNLMTIAQLDPKEYPEGFDDHGPLCQFGNCCGHEAVSYVKNAICPICENPTYGT